MAANIIANFLNANSLGVGCGADFSVILDIKGGLHSFGLPEYGQLGHNTDGKYFKTSTKLCFHFQTSPKRIVLYIEKSKDGHVSPVDVTEVVPRLIKYFDSQSRGVRSVHCGSTYSLAVTEYNGLFMFGQTKKTGEANMYPKPIQDLAGWNIKHVAAGFTSIIVAADDTVIAWGGAPCYGELGLGEMQKTSTTPREQLFESSDEKENKVVVVNVYQERSKIGDFVENIVAKYSNEEASSDGEVNKLAGIKVLGLAMGLCFTLLIAQGDTPEQKEKLEALKEYKC
ncbi:hypothetical protein NQ317_019865 [Molorchus minor]|uniref:Uncharacterized protein n=1 Tax=Molorchus minor TaxID=1323400 RepID=A0ABQ9ITT6_9CUCU|nr:hypothetical protein NQ317_019865 [Molorchus minor]